MSDDASTNLEALRSLSHKKKRAALIHKMLSGAFLLSLGTMTSRILGLIRDMAMAALFDRAVTDAWTVAFRLPNLFRRLFGEGSLSLGFIPVFVDLREQDPSGDSGPQSNECLLCLSADFFGDSDGLGIIFYRADSASLCWIRLTPVMWKSIC